MADWTTHPYAVVDVEGNGHHPPALVELAVVPIDHGRIGPARTWLVRPPDPITGIARRIHGITNSDVAAQPAVADVAAEIRAALAGRVVVAHNAHVDLDVLTREQSDWTPAAGVVDTLKLSRALLPASASHKLSTVTEQLHLDQDLPTGARAHRAEHDALTCAHLFVHLAGLPGGPAAITTAIHASTEGASDDALF